MPFALITGASKGIGKSIAEQLAARGFDLLLIARSADLLEQVAKEISQSTNKNCQFLALDLAEDQAAESVFEYCNKNQFVVSVLVNNAGYGLSGRFEKYSVQEHTDMLRVNIITLTKLTRLFLPLNVKTTRSLYSQYRQFRILPGSTFIISICGFKSLCAEL